jgi:hypothetical protein
MSSRALLSRRATVRQLPAGILQVRAHEPLELLQLADLADDQILRNEIEFVESVDGLAGVLHDSGVDEIERGQMRLHRIPAHRVVVPGTVRDDRTGRALG